MFLRRYVIKTVPKINQCNVQFCTADGAEDTEFRVLNLRHVKDSRPPRSQAKRTVIMPPRSKKMATDQDWGAVWPGPRTFHPATVPLPLRQGYVKRGVAPDKFANAELMKIPNFLHLTPPVIKRQCEALKKFCTPWPKQLDSDAKCTAHFPLEVVRTSYCHSSPTIRDPNARIVTIQFPLDALSLHERARDKFLRLVAERHNERTGLVTIVADRCPTRQQNEDYLMYLLTALYHESLRVEPWESLKKETDMEVFKWPNSTSQNNIESIFAKPAAEISHIDQYVEKLCNLMNKGESERTVDEYAESVQKLLQI